MSPQQIQKAEMKQGKGADSRCLPDAHSVTISGHIL